MRLDRPSRSLVIDDRGVVWPAETAVLARWFGSIRWRGNLALNAVTLGFVFVKFSAQHLGIAFRPQFVTEMAVSRLASLIIQSNWNHCALSYDGRLSRWELVIGGAHTIKRIEGLVDEARQAPPHRLFACEPLPLDRCRDIAGGRLAPLLELWHQRHGRWDAALQGCLTAWKLLPVTVITEQTRRSERVIIQSWGVNLTSFGKYWPVVARGRDTEDRPNLLVGRLFSTMVRETINEGRPRLHGIDHVFRGGGAGELLRTKYSRLALPWRTSEGSTLVTETSIARRTFFLEGRNRAN